MRSRQLSLCYQQSVHTVKFKFNYFEFLLIFKLISQRNQFKFNKLSVYTEHSRTTYGVCILYYKNSTFFQDNHRDVSTDFV